MGKKKVVLIGWDAADWQIIQPMLAAGKLPTLKKFISEGVHGNMSTMNPPYSPMLWTSVATGKTPDKHGVLGFIELDPELQKIRPVTVTQRKVKAIWNILHNQGLKSNLIGWWPSYPAEPINGVIISDQFTKVTAKIEEEWPLASGSIHPAELGKELADLRIHPQEITGAHLVPFIPDAANVDQSADNPLQILAKIISHNASIHACSTWTMENTEWDFTGIYYDLIDHMCHAFMKFHPPRLPQVPVEMFEKFNQAVEGAYRFQDMMLERTLELAGDDALVIIMSDHGFVSDGNRMLKTPDVHAAPSLEHREFGIFAARGPGIKKNEKIYGASLLDITPTILAYLGIPIGEDMDGMVLNDLFEEPIKSTKIPSWEDVSGDFGMHTTTIKGDPFSEQKAMEQLIELGYVDRPDADLEKSIKQTRCDLEFNLARVYMGKGELDKCEEILLSLIQEEVKIHSYLVDLIHLMIVQQSYRRAMGYLNQLRKLDPNSLQKTRLMEAKILIGMKDGAQAMKIMEELEKKPLLAGPVHFELGKLFLGTDQTDKALVQFQKACELMPEHAKYHHGLATCYLKLNQLEAALDHALTSVELVRYFPDAHYTLGRILEKMGDEENAKIAYDMAIKLRPEISKAKLAKENLELSNEPQKQESTAYSSFPEIVIVSGLPRSGTSMMMQMLHSAGLPILSDNERKEDSDNPRGYFEYEKVKSLHLENDWLHEAEGKVVKIIVQLLKHLPKNFRYTIIFMTRDLDEVLESQKVMLKNNGVRPKEGVREAFVKELERLDRWVEHEPGVRLLKVPYHEVVNNPSAQAEAVAIFLGKKLDTHAMTAAVDGKLYRNRIYKFKPN